MAITATVLAVGTAAYGKRQANKARDRAEANAQTQALIEGSAPSISNVGEVVAEDVQGSAAADISESLKAMDYLAEEKVPFPNFDEETAGMNPMEGQIPEELAMLLEAESQQGIMGMASGGAVGTPEDVYYFGVPQIMGMMQDPNPQIQGVGMQLADQMATMPDAGMVPATANQIQTMAMGGAVTAKKFEEGGGTSTAQSIREGFVSNLPIIAQINALKDVREAEGLEKLVEGLDVLPVNPVKLLRNIKARKELRAERKAEEQADREREEAMVFGPQSRANGGPITAQRFQDGSQSGIENYDPELDVDFIAQQEAFEELLELNGLVDKGVISEARAENDRQLLMRVLQPGRTVSDLDRKNLKRSSGKKANGGPITSERLNQLRRR